MNKKVSKQQQQQQQQTEIKLIIYMGKTNDNMKKVNR